MKKGIIKEVKKEDIKKIYNFFIKNIDIYSKNFITAREIKKIFPEYRVSDIREIISQMNDLKLKRVIVGGDRGYMVCTKENKIMLMSMLIRKSISCNTQLKNIHLLQNRVELVND